MSESFTLEIVNGKFGDPPVRLQVAQRPLSILFDLGPLNALSYKQIIRVDLVCVSHTHMDHFMGFEELLRSKLPSGSSVCILGPKGVKDQILFKLKGYTWNLIDSHKINIVVVENDGTISKIFNLKEQIHSRAYHSEEKGQPITIDPQDHDLSIHFGNDYSVSMLELDHGIPSIAYRVELRGPDKLQQDQLQKLGLEPGPWLAQLKDPTCQKIQVGEREWDVQELACLFQPARSQTVGYFTDIGFTPSNVERILASSWTVDTLVCETSFLDKEQNRAREKMHLTVPQGVLLARLMGASQLETFHFSNLYKKDGEKNHQEEQELWWEKTAGLDQGQLKELCKSLY